jgi:hypothetical protein
MMNTIQQAEFLEEPRYVDDQNVNSGLYTDTGYNDYRYRDHKSDTYYRNNCKETHDDGYNNDLVYFYL